MKIYKKVPLALNCIPVIQIGIKPGNVPQTAGNSMGSSLLFFKKIKNLREILVYG